MSINKILTSQYQDLSQEEIANLQHTLGPVIGGGLEGYWRPTVSELGNITWTWSNASTATPPAGMNIKGDKGDPGQDGTDGKRPVMHINSENAHWEWKYYGDTTPWIDLDVVASGERGPNGYSIDLQSISAGQGGNLITLQWGDPTDLSTSSFFLPSGKAGVSPTVELTPIQDQQYPQGGWNVTITDAEHQSGQTFQIFNGINGEGATVDLSGGNGIQVTHVAGTTDYTISVSADYALKSELPDVTDMATKTWVGQQGFLKNSDLTDYATKTYANDASANALNEAESWVGQQGYLKSVPDSYATKTYANEASANALSEAETWVNQKNFATSAGLDDNKQYAMTTNGWADFTIPSTSGYLPLTGGTVSGQLVVSATSGNFDSQFFKLVREGVNGYGRIGLGSNGPIALKVDDSNGHTTQVNISPNATNDQLVQVQHGGTTSYLIPAQIHQGSYTPTTADGILHIVLES